MIEISASFTSAQASYTKIQASSERSAVAIEGRGNKTPPPPNLSNQEQQIVDEVGISEQAVQKFQEAQALATQLQDYLDYLNGKTSDNGTSVQITAPTTANDNDQGTTIAGRSTQIAASVEVATYTEETLDINAKFDNAGNLQELSVSQTSITAEYVRAEASYQDTQFYARA